MNSFLLTLAAIILFVLGALFIAPNYIQWNDYKDVFEEYASQVAGRKVQVVGDVKLKILPAPYLEFTQVKVHQQLNDPGVLLRRKGLDEPVAEMESFKLWLAIPPLLQGNIKVTKLEVIKPNIRLQVADKVNRPLVDSSNVDLPFLPGEISFESIRIVNGNLNFAQSRQSSPISLKEINGELAIASLKGPYRFNGYFTNAGEIKEISLATSQQDQLGNVRLKSVIEVPKTKSRYLINGELQALDNIPSFKGTLSGQVPIDLLVVENNKAFLTKNGDTSGNLIDVRSNVYANSKRLELRELSISVADNKRPQNIDGELILNWEQGLELQSKIKANWLDLDKMLAQKSEAVPASEQGAKKEGTNKSVQIAFGLLKSIMQDTGQLLTNADIKAEINDAKLGNSDLSNFNFQLIKNGPKYRIERLSVQLPGRNNVSLNGNLLTKNDTLAFSGDVRAKGISLGALTHWALFDQKGKTFQSNPYFLKGRVKFSPGKFDISNLRGDLNGSRISGNFRYNFSDKKEFILKLDSDSVDLSDVLDNDTTLSSLIRMATSNSGKGQNDENNNETKKDVFSSYTKELKETEGQINLRIGRVSIPNLKAKDVLINGELSGGDFRLSSFKMIADGGVKINGKGLIRNISEDAKGNVRLSVRAESAKGLAILARQLEFSDDFVENKRRLKDLSPLRLAVTVNMHSGGLPSTEISIAGDVANSQLTLNARHEGIFATLGEKQIDLSGTLVNPEAKDLISQLVSLKQIKSLEETGQGVFSIQANGIPNEAIEARARLDAGTTQARFNGDVSIQSGISSGSGTFTVKSANAAAGLSLIGLTDVNEFSGKPMNLSTRIRKEKSEYHFSKLRGKIAKIKLSGDAKIDWDSQPRKLNVNGQISETSLASILSPLLPSARPSNIQQVLESSGAKLENTWSNRPFNTANMKGVTGSIKLRVGRLEIAKDTNLANASLGVVIKNNTMDIKNLSGELYNGQFSARAQLAANRGPVKLNADVSLKNADLAEVFKTKNGSALARGVGTASLSFSGQGLSPLGLVAELKGKGKLRVGEGEIFDFSPQALPEIISTSTGKENDETLGQKFLQRLRGNTFALRNVSSALKLNDGVLSIDKMNLKVSPTEAVATTYIELASMKLDSEWKLSALNRKRKKIPGVKLIFSGPLSNLTNISPQVDVSELKQSLVVRNIEKNFDTLDKLNERDPETIRRLRNSPQVLSPDTRKDPRVSIIKEKPQDLRNQKPQNDNFNVQDNNTNELPELTNLGKIDKESESTQIGDNRELGVKYYYDQNGNPVEQEGLNAEENTQEQNEIQKETTKKKKRRAPSFFDRIFREALGR